MTATAALRVLTLDTPSLGDRSYVVHDGEVAVVVDPQRDVDRVHAVLDAEGVRVTHVVETHVHNDYLEALVERGVPGLVTVCAPVIVLLVGLTRWPRPASPVLSGTAAAVAAGAACALVDFPFARPAELAIWWVAIALALQGAVEHATASDGPCHV